LNSSKHEPPHNTGDTSGLSNLAFENPA
jgi:hypothetical protein